MIYNGNPHWGDRGNGIGKTQAGLVNLKGLLKFEGLTRIRGGLINNLRGFQEVRLRSFGVGN